jgi:hypothetical protein
MIFEECASFFINGNSAGCVLTKTEEPRKKMNPGGFPRVLHRVS